ncbi:MAG TPA: VOC family protein [Usitatibacter sp.]|nr:VOC family protein [Usitatibacter sp.]
MIDRFHHMLIEPKDFEASLKFYRDVLGWAVTLAWGGKGKPRGTILSGGGIKVVITERDPAAKGPMCGPDVFLDIHDIDARFKEIPKGAHVVTPPGPTKWGTRWFVVKDPDGNEIAFEEVHSFKRG